MKYIILEGITGTGKSTMYKMLSKQLVECSGGILYS